MPTRKEPQTVGQKMVLPAAFMAAGLAITIFGLMVPLMVVGAAVLWMLFH